MKTVNIINIDSGNLYSIEKAIKKIGYKAHIIEKIENIHDDQSYIIPGVGSFFAAMSSIRKKKLIKPIKEIVKRNIKLLGICVGMQLLSKSSAEDKFSRGLGLINTKVVKLKEKKKIIVPHVGFNNVSIKNCIKLFKNINDNSDFYFDHSYKMSIPKKAVFKFAETNHNQKFISAFEKKNLFGVQFHPEKSKDNGLQLLKNFLEL